MDTIIGLGGAGCNLAEKFSEYPQYKVLKIDSESRPFDWLAKGFKLIPKQETPEDYEKNCPSIDDFVKEAGDEVLFIIAGGGKISGALLRILEQFRHKKLSVLYIQPDTDLLPRSAKMQERLAFGVIQEYARSAVFERAYLVKNSTIEDILGDVPISNYYDTINSFIASAIHMINVFKHTDPISSNFERENPVSRITTFGMVNLEDGSENLFFPLQYPREKVYYYAINKNRLNTDKGLHRKIMQQIKSKINSKDIEVTYGIYSTDYDNDYVYSIANASFVQS